ncbi:unnamed protein product [Paramecium octaurelia]|uniref:Tetratricopeptide repeat protein n=2 Tax=Paramecium octaurelia TaxID=43137 RepID=A0A8S1RYH5_PAROT|nr:unnamed protein product [Paramecium octaurelia]
MEELKCQFKAHKDHPIIGFCTNMNCLTSTSFCFKCLPKLHLDHHNDCLEFNPLRVLINEHLQTHNQLVNLQNELIVGIQKYQTKMVQYNQRLEEMDNHLKNKSYLTVKQFIPFIKYLQWQGTEKKQRFLIMELIKIIETLKALTKDQLSVQQKRSNTTNDKQETGLQSGLCKDQKAQKLYQKDQCKRQKILERELLNNQQQLQALKFDDALKQNNKVDREFHFPAEKVNFNFFQIGNSLNNLNFFFEAIECYDLALEINPNNSDAFNLKGNSLHNLNLFEEAIEYYDKSIQINPNDCNAFYNKGLSLQNLSRYQEAISCYDKAIALNPADYDAYINKGLILNEFNRYQEAIECYDKALQINANNYEAFKNKGITLHNLDCYDKAIECYDNVLQRNPNDYDTLINKGLSLLNLNRYLEAISCYDQVLWINPADCDALNLKGLSLNNLNYYEEAIVCYDNALMINPSDQNALINKGNSLHDQGCYEQAIACYDNVLQINPHDQDALNLKGISLHDFNRYSEAIECFDQTLTIDPNDFDAFNLKGLSLHYLDIYKETIKFYDSALKRNPNPNYMKSKADALFKIGKREESKEWYINARNAGFDKDIIDNIMKVFI